MIDNKINTLLQNQFLFLTNIIVNINYLLELSQIQGEGRKPSVKRQYINYIARFAMDDYAMKIHKIILRKIRTHTHFTNF